MGTSIPVKAPTVQEVTSTEALQGGLNAKRPLEGEAKKRVERFVTAHAQTSRSGTEQGAESAKTAAPSSLPQVSAEEQQQAALQKGAIALPGKRNGKNRKFENVYKTLFVNNGSFFEKDMMSLLNSFRSKSKSLVDMTTSLSPGERALRKFLLLETLQEQGDALLSNSDRVEIKQAKSQLLSEHGAFISGTLGAYEVGKAKSFSGPSLREFITAYQIIEIQPSTTSATDLFALYKMIKKDLQAGASTEKLVRMQEGFIQILVREKTQEPARITSPRHHLILSRIKQFGLLINLHALHSKFLGWGQKANMQGLPTLTSLTESCLQAVLSNETLAGANSLIAIASAVRSDRMPAKNAFITNYCRWVLLHDLISGMYRNSNQRKILVENIERNTQLSAILAPVIQTPS